jgi:hypothetical protein
VIAEEIKAAFDPPMKVLSGCFSELSAPSIWSTTFTAPQLPAGRGEKDDVIHEAM